MKIISVPLNDVRFHAVESALGIILVPQCKIHQYNLNTIKLVYSTLQMTLRHLLLLVLIT